MNLAPGGVRKHGAGLELAVALGLLVASDAAPGRRASTAPRCSASSGLDGSVRAVPGMLALVDALRAARRRDA